MSITRNRELSQFGSFLYIDDSNQNIGIATDSLNFVGVGTGAPTSKVDIVGNVKISGVVTATTFYGSFIGNSSSASGISSTASLNTSGIITASSFYVNGIPLVNAALQTWSTTGIGGTTYLLNGNVGIGTSRPDEKLSVIGNINSSGNISASRFISTIASSSGFSPLTVSSNVLVTNLNADLLRGKILGGTASGDIVSIDAVQTLSNKTLSLSTLTRPTVSSAGIAFSGTSGITTLRADANASGVLTLPAVTDTLVTRTTTETLTNKTISASSNTISGLTNSNLSGNAAISNANLANSTISGVSLGSNLNSLTVGSYLSFNVGSTYNGSAARTISVKASSSNSDPTNFPIVARDASGDFSAGTITATSFSGSLNGNASTATTLQTPRLINGVSFNGSADITISSTNPTITPNSLTLNTAGTGLSGSASFNGASATTFTVTSNATRDNTANTIVARDGFGNFNAGIITATTFSGNVSGNATSADTSTNASAADTVDTVETTFDANFYLTFVSSSSSFVGATIRVDSGITFNPSTDTLTTTNVTATDFISTSDINLKKNINPVENALDKLHQLNGVSFEWKNNDSKSIGVIAQEVEKIFPELVRESEDVKAVNYNGLVGVLIEAVKELQAEVEELKKKVS